MIRKVQKVADSPRFIFMLLASINFALHFRAVRGKPLIYFRDSEGRVLLAIWLFG